MGRIGTRTGAATIAALGLLLAGCGDGDQSTDARSASSSSTSSSTTSSSTATSSTATATTPASTDSSTPTPSSSGSATAVPTATIPADAITADADAIFTMPSGRISCVMTEEEVRCDVMRPTFEPREEDLYACDFDLGHSLVLVGREAQLGCVSDSLVGSAGIDSQFTTWWTEDLGEIDGQAILPYGRTLVRGSHSCTSAEAGVTCLDARTGAGFELARERYALINPSKG